MTTTIPATVTEYAAQLRAQAQGARARAEESFDRCGTDGFASQICHRLEASRLRLAADLVENEGLAQFWGLYEIATGRRVAARPVLGAFGEQWELHGSEADLIRRRGKPWIPTGRGSRVLKSLGLVQCRELAPGVAKVVSPEGARGFSGLEVTRVEALRAGDSWGEADALRLTWVEPEW